MASSFSKRGARGRRTVNEINMVPFIDVMLVLLIIFMVTAPMITPGVINAPSVGSADQTPPAIAQVLVNSAGQLEWKVANADPRGASLEQIAELAKDWEAQQLREGKTAEQYAIVIVGDKQAAYEHVMNALTELQKAEIKRVAFLLNKK